VIHGRLRHYYKWLHEFFIKLKSCVLATEVENNVATLCIPVAYM
jgi:hypothetical protein